MAMEPATAPRAQLIKLETDRRLGHEWDEWDGTPLPNEGWFDSPPGLFFAWSAFAAAVGFGLLFGLALLLHPHLAALAPGLPGGVMLALAVLAGLTTLWWLLLAAAYALRKPILPERLAERGPFLRLMRLTSRLASRFGRRDWVENAAVKVFNSLALMRGRRVSKGELLLLVPRCLSRETLDGVLAIAGRYEVPVFVATRGVIRERRPRAVVAVACERDMVSGLHDVAGKVPVLGLTLRLASGPCKDTAVDLGQLEEWVRTYVGESEGRKVGT
jgi:hypothetical protein